MPNAKELIEKIKSWREIAVEQGDNFVKFALEYFAFNALARLYLAPNDEVVIDRQLINKVKQNEGYKNYILTHNQRWVAKLKEELSQKPLINLAREREHIVIRNEEDWENIVEAVYLIRNNLFHGYKYPGDKRDQDLVEIGYNLLSTFNEYLIGKV